MEVASDVLGVQATLDDESKAEGSLPTPDAPSTVLKPLSALRWHDAAAGPRTATSVVSGSQLHRPPAAQPPASARRAPVWRVEA